MRSIVILAAGLLCGAGCNEKSAAPRSSESAAAGSQEPAPPQTHIFSGNLDELYQCAIADFAEYEMTQRNPEWAPRRFRLGHLRDDVELDDDSGSRILHLAPGQFAGVNFKTAMGDRLQNADHDTLTRKTDGIHTVGVQHIWHSKSMRRVQITLGWIDTIGESWTFLYDIDEGDNLRLSKSVNLGCNFPEGWID